MTLEDLGRRWLAPVVAVAWFLAFAAAVSAIITAILWRAAV
jgi:hypothetical protein